MDTLRGENRVGFTKGLLQSMDIVHKVLFALFEGVRLTPVRQVGHKFRIKAYLSKISAETISICSVTLNTFGLAQDRNEKEKCHSDKDARSLLLCSSSRGHPWSTSPWFGGILHKK